MGVGVQGFKFSRDVQLREHEVWVGGRVRGKTNVEVYRVCECLWVDVCTV